MALEEKIILSILIPTYNRRRYLCSNLSAIFSQLKDNDKKIEVIVSDNCSPDGTDEAVKPYLEKDNFKYYRQKENVGAIRNILGIVNYAKGDFCWIVGDDDFLLNGAIEKVLDLIINHPDVDYIYAKVRGLDFAEYQKGELQYLSSYRALSNQLKSKIEFEEIQPWETLIGPDYSIIFLGELMASVFRKEVWLQYRLEPEGEFLSSLETSYPHSVVLANTFFGKKSIYIRTPLILALDGVREWWDQLGYILIVHIKSLLDLYKEKGLKKNVLQKCYRSYIMMTLPYIFKFLVYPHARQRELIPFRQYFKFLSNNFFLFCRALSSYMVNFVKYILLSLYRLFKQLFFHPIPLYYSFAFYLLLKKNGISTPKNASVRGRINIKNKGKIKIGDYFSVNSGLKANPIGGDTAVSLIADSSNAELTIGENVGISNSTIVCWNKITIGDNVLIGGSTKIWDTNFHSLNPTIRVSGNDDDIRTAPIMIEQNVFIGASCIILKGVTIGKNTIISAGSVVTKSIPSNVIAGGNPCVVIRTLETNK